MLEKPDIPEPLIVTRLQAEYRLDVAGITFLPLGYDIHTAVYQVVTPDGARYFLKLRKAPFDLVAVAIPQLLHIQGIRSIIAPLATRTGQLYGTLVHQQEEIKLILYPYVEGKDGYQVKLTDRHWIELGRTFQLIHATVVPSELTKLVPRERYDPRWRERVRGFQVQVEHQAYHDPIARALAALMRSKRYAITHIVRRAGELAEVLCRQPMDFVLCHSDAHPGNYLITNTGELYLVDWDNPILALRERDLMFFGSGMSGDAPGDRQESLFYRGYGKVDVNRQALAYYRFERIVQDIAEFCTQLLLTSTGGDDRQQSYEYFISSFAPGGTVDAALQTDG